MNFHQPLLQSYYFTVIFDQFNAYLLEKIINFLIIIIFFLVKLATFMMYFFPILSFCPQDIFKNIQYSTEKSCRSASMQGWVNNVI